MSIFGDNLKTLRKAKGYTQQSLADKVGCIQNTIASYETRGKIPHKEIKQKLIEVLDCTEADLFGYSDGYSKQVQDINEALYFNDDKRQAPACVFDENGKISISETTWCYLPGHIKDDAKDGYFFYMKDDSMILKIPVHCDAYIKPLQALEHGNGHVCLVTYNKKPYLRRLHKLGNNIILEPETNNKKYEKIYIDLDKETDFTLHGRVIYFCHGVEGL